VTFFSGFGFLDSRAISFLLLVTGCGGGTRLHITSIVADPALLAAGTVGSARLAAPSTHRVPSSDFVDEVVGLPALLRSTNS
jgi:hypothetical protein